MRSTVSGRATPAPGRLLEDAGAQPVNSLDDLRLLMARQFELSAKDLPTLYARLLDRLPSLPPHERAEGSRILWEAAEHLRLIVEFHDLPAAAALVSQGLDARTAARRVGISHPRHLGDLVRLENGQARLAPPAVKASGRTPAPPPVGRPAAPAAPRRAA